MAVLLFWQLLCEIYFLCRRFLKPGDLGLYLATRMPEIALFPDQWARLPLLQHLNARAAAALDLAARYSVSTVHEAKSILRPFGPSESSVMCKYASTMEKHLGCGSVHI